MTNETGWLSIVGEPYTNERIQLHLVVQTLPARLATINKQPLTADMTHPGTTREQRTEDYHRTCPVCRRAETHC